MRIVGGPHFYGARHYRPLSSRSRCLSFQASRLWTHLLVDFSRLCNFDAEKLYLPRHLTPVLSNGLKT